MTRTVIYARVSSEEQAAEGKTSIETQKNDCRALAKSLGWIVVGEFVDDKKFRVGKKLVEPSGTRADRPQWRRMLEALAAGKADALIAWHSSRCYRAYRPMVDFLDILDAHPTIRVELVKEQFNKQYAIFDAWKGKQENEARVYRTYQGWAGRARKGLAATRVSTFYKPIIEPQTGEKLGYEFDERYRVAFDGMARLFLQQLSYREIAKRLGINPRTLKRWNYKTIHDILQNPFYRGLIAYGRRSHKGIAGFTAKARHRAVWNDATCAAIDLELARRTVVGSHAPRSKVTPFAGVLRCGYCGWLMSATHSGERMSRDGTRPYRFYYCHHNRLVAHGYEPGQPHPANGIPEATLLKMLRAEMAELDAQDIEMVLMLLASQLPSRPVDQLPAQADLARLEAEIADLALDLDRVRGDRARAAIDADLARLRESAAAIREQLSVSGGVATIDLDDMRAGLMELAGNPALLLGPDAEIKRLIARAFRALYLKDGQFVPAPRLEQESQESQAPSAD